MLGPTGVAVIQWLPFNLSQQPPWVKQTKKQFVYHFNHISIFTSGTSKHQQLDFTVMGDICWRSGEVVLVVMEEERRSVETFYDCIDLELEENTFNVDQVGANSDNPP